MKQNDLRDDGSRNNRRTAMDPTDGTLGYSEPRDESPYRPDRGTDPLPALTSRERHERWPIG